MSQLIQTSSECCNPCPSPLVENIPGPQGPTGAAGTNGTNGVNAYTTLTASFVMPAEAGNVTVAVVDGTWMVVGQKVAVGKFGDAAFGTFQVVQVISQTSVTLTNVEDTATGAYAGNSAPGTTFPSGAKIAPSGLQGVTGSAPGGVFLIANNLSEGTLATKQANLGIGTAGTRADAYFFQVANNLSEGVGATKRTNLGLGSAAVLDAGVTSTRLPPIDTTFTNGDAVFATAAGVQTKSAANARLALGIGGMAGAYALLQDQHASGVASGAFANGAPVVVPLNTEVSDPSGIVSLAANVFTLGTGAYRISAKVLGYIVAGFQSRLFNISDAAVAFYGTSADSPVADNASGVSFIEGRLVVAGGPKNYRLEAQCTTSNATNGFGKAAAIGGFTECYATLEIVQET